MKTTTNIIYPVFALFALGCFALSPTARAVTPAKGADNTAIGYDALYSTTTSSDATRDLPISLCFLRQNQFAVCAVEHCTIAVAWALGPFPHSKRFWRDLRRLRMSLCRRLESLKWPLALRYDTATVF